MVPSRRWMTASCFLRTLPETLHWPPGPSWSTSTCLGPVQDVAIVLQTPPGPHIVFLFDSGQPVQAGSITDLALQVAFGPDFIEVNIPYSVLLPFLPDLALPDR